VKMNTADRMALSFAFGSGWWAVVRGSMNVISTVLAKAAAWS
jgi:hypothetical protein